MLYNIFIFQPQIKKHLNFSPNKYVKTSFDLIPEQEWTQAQKARTINL